MISFFFLVCILRGSGMEFRIVRGKGGLFFSFSHYSYFILFLVLVFTARSLLFLTSKVLHCVQVVYDMKVGIHVFRSHLMVLFG